MSPVNIAMYVRFTNEKPNMMMIDGYSVEAQLPTGGWKIVPSFPPAFDTLLVSGDLRQFAAFEPLPGCFNSEIANKNIASHETVIGWMLLQSPKDEHYRNFRFRLREADGTESVEAIDIPVAEKPLSTLVQSAKAKGLGQVEIVDKPAIILLDDAGQSYLAPGFDTITPEQKQYLLSGIGRYSGSEIRVRSEQGDKDAEGLKMQLRDVLTEAGWKVGTGTFMGSGGNGGLKRGIEIDSAGFPKEIVDLTATLAHIGFQMYVVTNSP